ncbi:hypothetical protein ONV78_20290 [Hahella sp. CR1]|uniref:hypothetical protein n=1 Tax=Hahella sp. CR1 TaxID=2992807 RepID=UPI002442C1F5|nr:hypothetical protein [Hahella sp. CR1]MDG9670087.1 hypothetical protein [Hahella sp. CR1]
MTAEHSDKQFHIQPGVGIGDLIFGLGREDVEKLLGAPDKEHVNDYNDVFLHYHEKQLALRFDHDSDLRLSWIDCHNPKAVLFGQSLIGEPQGEVLKVVQSHHAGKSEVDEFLSFESHTYHDIWTEFQFNDGRLTNINLGYVFDEDHEPVWPERSS